MTLNGLCFKMHDFAACDKKMKIAAQSQRGEYMRMILVSKRIRITQIFERIFQRVDAK